MAIGIPQIASAQDRERVSQSSRHRFGGNSYTVQRIVSFEQQVAYQRLRYQTFIERLKWNIPATDGREHDHYDLTLDLKDSISIIHSFGVFGTASRQRYLLGGVRVFALSSWDASMTMGEFQDAGMLPNDVLQRLIQRYPDANLLVLCRTMPYEEKSNVRMML